MIKLDEKFAASVIIDGVLIPNLWDIKINLFPHAEKVLEQKNYMKVVDRIQYYISETLENSILLGPESFNLFSKGIGIKGKVHFLPDEPFDHMLAISLYTKVHAILEDVFFIDSVQVSSYQSSGISHSHSVDTGDINTLRDVALPGHEDYAEYWFRKECQWFTLNEEGLQLKTIPWEELDLGLDKKPGTVVNLNDFKPKLIKPEDDEDDTDT
jgi:hypothetical protein